jgi:hypothetical protein
VELEVLTNRLSARYKLCSISEQQTPIITSLPIDIALSNPSGITVNVPDNQAKPRPCRGMLSLRDGMNLRREVAERNCARQPTLLVW